jgi:hypothetical protein
VWSSGTLAVWSSGTLAGVIEAEPLLRLGRHIEDTAERCRMPSRLMIQAAAAVAVLGLAGLAGCAAPSSDSRGQPNGTVDGTPGVTSTASAGATDPDTATSAPAVSVPPTGPAATAAAGSPPPAAPHAVAKIGTVSVSCPDGAPFGDPAAHTRQPLAPAVTITSVVRCETVQRDYPGLGQWDVQLAEVADAGFQQLVVELRKPSAPSTDGPCPAIGYVIPAFMLLAADGTVLRPTVPTGTCGQPSAAAMTELNGLPFEAVDAVRVRQIASPTAVESGCAQQAKDMPAIVGASNREASGRVADLASSPSLVRLCLYRIEPVTAQTSAGELVAGRTLTGDLAAEIAGETGDLTHPLPAGCADAARFVTISFGPNMQWGAAVELDGCHRIYTYDGFFGTASPGLADALETTFAGS